MILGAPRRIRPPDANPPILLRVVARVGARVVLIRVVFVRSRGPLVTLRGASSLSTGRGARARGSRRLRCAPAAAAFVVPRRRMAESSRAFAGTKAAAAATGSRTVLPSVRRRRVRATRDEARGGGRASRLSRGFDAPGPCAAALAHCAKALARSGVTHTNSRSTLLVVLWSTACTTFAASWMAIHVLAPSSWRTWNGWDSEGSWNTTTALTYRLWPCSLTLQIRSRRPSQRCGSAPRSAGGRGRRGEGGGGGGGKERRRERRG